jgi:hypothetical protein
MLHEPTQQYGINTYRNSTSTAGIIFKTIAKELHHLHPNIRLRQEHKRPGILDPYRIVRSLSCLWAEENVAQLPQLLALKVKPIYRYQIPMV